MHSPKVGFRFKAGAGSECCSQLPQHLTNGKALARSSLSPSARTCLPGGHVTHGKHKTLAQCGTAFTQMVSTPGEFYQH